MNPPTCQVIEPLYKPANGPQICADGGYNIGVDVCQGDSGTGVTVKGKGSRQYLTGLVSYETNVRGLGSMW